MLKMFLIINNIYLKLQLKMGRRLIITESEKTNISKMYGLVNESTGVGYTLKKEDTDTISISLNNGKKYYYTVKGNYGFSFDIEIKNLEQQSNGTVTGEVKPKSDSILSIAKNQIENKNVWNGDYLKIKLSPENIKNALRQLDKNNNEEAEIKGDVDIILTSLKTDKHGRPTTKAEKWDSPFRAIWDPKYGTSGRITGFPTSA